ncbi:Concanavalin A-like lectin/glucanase [Macrophomina phaseolina MS6]|uniref:Concanavalin A-like lectin/glucanase n=1 Tax=Macrophomina phaseolina (strain MS6) TaxID=1126212 RepID=K2S126_MACPH|nr:Concanavalin A-like lectin/glucanase [Macrophomina phaseolina MS6]
MADPQPPSRGTTPGLTPGVKRPHDEDHAPAVPSPLNPDPAARPRPAKAPQREQREKRDSLKKREAQASSRGTTPDIKVKNQLASTPAPLNYIVETENLKPQDFDAPKAPAFISHEPPLFTPDGQLELKRPLDNASNRKQFRYYPCVADPLFRHKQYFRQTDSKPFAPRLSFEDSDKWIHFDDSATVFTNERGWRMSRANVVAREGRYYYEVKIIRGVPSQGPPVTRGQEGNPQPHVRMGWARREAPLDAPTGFDGYSYGIKDIGFETMHKSRPGKLYNPATKGSKKPKPPPGKPQVEYIEEDHIREGDVIGLEIVLPSISLHRKVVEGIYNPAVDISDGFEDPVEGAHDIIRDRIAVPFKGNNWFEVNEYQPTKPMESYADRGTFNSVTPSPNHSEVPLRSLPHSAIRVYRNGKPVGTAFEGLMAFLPPASSPVPSSNPLVRAGLDDGMLGYFPAVAAFCGGIAQVNFGPDFWCPPPGLEDVDMGGSDGVSPEGRKLRPIGDRYKEQIAEDIVWDIIDDVGFYVANPGDDQNSSRTGAIKPPPTARGIANLKEDDGF